MGTCCHELTTRTTLVVFEAASPPGMVRCRALRACSGRTCAPRSLSKSCVEHLRAPFHVLALLVPCHGYPGMLSAWSLLMESLSKRLSEPSCGWRTVHHCLCMRCSVSVISSASRGLWRTGRGCLGRVRTGAYLPSASCFSSKDHSRLGLDGCSCFALEGSIGSSSGHLIIRSGRGY